MDIGRILSRWCSVPARMDVSSRIVVHSSLCVPYVFIEPFFWSDLAKASRIPNFSAFLKWSREIFSGSEHRHFRLCREHELKIVQEQHPAEERIFSLSYGDDYRDLGPFLRRLMPRSEETYILNPSYGSISNSGISSVTFEALKRYRRALHARFSRWDIGPVAASAGPLGRNITAELDVMYLPLRLSIESEGSAAGERDANFS